MIWILMFALMDDYGDYRVIKTFENLPEASGDFLTNPYTMHFSADQELYVADRATGRIHVWNKDGKYERSFAGPGKGPGELEAPIRLVVTDSRVWVWELSQQISVFQRDGSFERSFKIPGITPRAFAVLNPDLLLLLYRGASGSGNDAHFIFKLVDGNGEELSVLKDFTKETLAPIEGDNRTIAKAFGPDGDIQRAPDGTWWFGFSESRKLYQIDAQGQVLGERLFELPTGKPNTEERDLVANMSFPTPNGQRISLKNLPNMRISYDHDKAFYTHFLFHKDKAVFALTPIGGFNGLGNGFYHASFGVNEAATGRALERGQYDFPEDSMVLYRDGHILAIVMEGQDIVLKEILLKGM